MRSVIEFLVALTLGGSAMWWMTRESWWWRMMADWCVPASALRWGQMVAPEHWIACPRCGNTDMWGHASDEPVGVTCATCGWVRYWGTVAGRLVDAYRQPGRYRFDEVPGRGR